MQKSLTGLASVTQLMATFIQLVGKNNEESLKNDLALFQSLQESRKTEMERKSDEYAAEVRKAEELNRVMGCVGKILGALLTIVSVVAAAFSGGASLALAAVGLALMVTDAIVQAATGNSFMEQALNPIMKAVIEPLIKLLSDAFTKMLEGLGVDSKKAKMIGSILGAIAGALVLVAAVVLVATVGKQAAAKLAENIGKIIGKTLTDLIPKFLKNFSSQLDDLDIEKEILDLAAATERLNLTDALNSNPAGNLYDWRSSNSYPWTQKLNLHLTITATGQKYRILASKIVDFNIYSNNFNNLVKLEQSLGDGVKDHYVDISLDAGQYVLVMKANSSYSGNYPYSILFQKFLEHHHHHH
nr:IpaB240-460-CPE194-319 [synthetic construct]